ncbi:M16 family metallopeptidase [Hugenholtzia roseola]|uniref:M16 family metallopeptidase n=1 Tax=Hugenholtzia roseola TaxID=1002 RepID=UPI0004050FE7|nr:pitrilysin family protein [Hugenholtzia roseola]
MKKIFSFLLLLFWLGSPLLAQTPKKVEFTEYTLENGLHVILHQDKSVPLVAVTVLYHVGSKNENPDRTGFAHFFEHLLFEGSQNIGRGEFDDYVERAGGTLNANTSFDRTFYYELLPSNQLELGLWLESERMLHAKVDNIGIETQRQVVKEERRQRIDNQPYGTMMENVFKLAYEKHPYKWPVIGYMEHLDAAQENDYKTFYETFYVPNNATLSIAGDIDIEETKKKIELYFGSIPKGKGEIPRPNVTEEPQTAERRGVIEDNIQLPAVIHAYKTPSIRQDDYYAVSMLMTLLSEGQSSRLRKSIQDKQNKALFIGAFPFGLEDSPSMSMVFALANLGSGTTPETLEAAMDEEYEKVKNELISEREHEKLINQIETQFYSQNSSMAGIAENLANYHVYYGDADLINTEIEKYRKVTRQDIQRVAQKYLNKENRVVLYYVPKKG